MQISSSICLSSNFGQCPFGMLAVGRSWEIGSSEGYRFGFNGKEADSETYGEKNIYDYGFRIYNPRLGKFLSQDPLFKVYPMYSPYQFASNTPIMAIDLDGLEAEISIYGTGKKDGDETQFKKESANNVEDNLTHTSEPVFTSAEFQKVLERQTEAEGSIGLLIVNSHSQYNGIIFDNGKYSRESFNDKGSYKGYTGNITIDDIKTNNKIIFDKGALVVFAGCNTASPFKNENPNLNIEARSVSATPIAETFTKETGVASIGADGYTSPRGLDGTRMADYSYYLFQMVDGTLTKTALGKSLTPEIIEWAQEKVAEPVAKIEPIKLTQISSSGGELKIRQPSNN